MMILWINSSLLALIAQLTVSFRHLFEIKMQFKEVIVLKSKECLSNRIISLYQALSLRASTDMKLMMSGADTRLEPRE